MWSASFHATRVFSPTKEPIVKFKCPSCGMSLKAEPEMAGKVVRCPGCNTKLQIPETAAAPPTNTGSVPSAAAPGMMPPPDVASTMQPPTEEGPTGKPQRAGWKESDPANPNLLVSLGIGAVLFCGWYGIMYAFNPPTTMAASQYNLMQYLAAMFIQRTWVNFAETFFFMWAIAIIYLKYQKLRHQREALLLDVLPVELGQEINSQNVDTFIDHVYNLPNRLRDSLMVNRIRKALELFEVKTNTGDVNTMMASQSNIDSARIGGSYSLLKVFLWAIPILGFIGTVLGLSSAIGSMDLTNAKDIDKIIGSISKVTSGLGTAFDTTLLGLVLAMFLQFPMSSLAKQEDDNLNNIDAFCNEVLLPRLDDGAGAGGGDTAAIADSVIKGLSSAQKEFLTDLNILSKRMNDYATNLDRRSDAFQATVTKEFVTNMTTMRAEVEGALRDSMKLTSQYVGALETGIRGLNTVLKELGEKQIVVQQVKKKGWFSRG
jgi:biopolymer transport protein ExbB/TolQ